MTTPSPAKRVKIYDRGVTLHPPGTFGEFQLTYRTGDMVAPSLENTEPLLTEIEHFLHCIKTGETPRTDGQFGAAVVRAVEMAANSKQGHGEELPEPCWPRGRNANVHCNHAGKEVLRASPRPGRNRRHRRQHPGLGLCPRHERSAHRSDCNIGDHAFVEAGVRLGNNVTVKNGVSVWQGVEVEDDVFLGPNCVFTNDPNPRAYIKKTGDSLVATRVRTRATIGANATIVCGITIGQYAFIGAGTVVIRDVPDFAMMVGNPARQIGWMCVCAHKLVAPSSVGSVRFPTDLLFLWQFVHAYVGSQASG